MEKSLNKTGKLKGLLTSQQFMAAAAVVLVYALFCFLNKDFRSLNTFTSILSSSYYIGFLAIGVTFVIATGGIDLSLGTVMICSALIGGRLHEKGGLPMWVAIVATFVIAISFGVINGALVAYLKVPAFIATLSTQMVSMGLGQIATKVQPTVWPGTASENGGYRRVFKFIMEREGTTNINIPVGIILLLLVCVTMGIVLNKAKTGRYILALGSNYEAARLSGINTQWAMMKSYIICGFFVGLAAIAYAAENTTIRPGQGAGFELNAIAGVVIGGTSLSGGSASIFGTFLGVMLMAILKTGLPYVKMQPHWQVFITGFVILFAVLLDIAKKKKR